MGWEDRPYYRDRGFSSNPLTALISGSVPLFTAFGIRVRAHSALIVFIASMLLFNWSEGYGWSSKLVSMSMLFGVILLHEFGHCFAARVVGGWASEILLWPTGGLAFPETPPRPWARFFTAAGGPLVNFAICAISAAVVLSLGGHYFVQLNPLHSLMPPAEIGWHRPAFYAWWLFIVSGLLLALNLLPIYPLDGGQMLQAVLWKFLGHHRSMIVTCVTGMCGSVAVGVFGLLHWDFLLILLAVWLFYSCYQQRMLLRELGPGQPWQESAGDFSSALYRDPGTSRRRVNKKAVRIARKHAREEAAERQRLDAILVKVSTRGIASLNWRERRALRRASEKRRQSETELKDFLGD
jgi:stage IV sporulation protein FB